FLALHPTSGSFVNALYEALLGRDADPAGLASWLGQLDSRAGTRAQVALGIINSAESLQGVVNAYFGVFLGRGPGAEEGAGWLGTLLRNQASLEAVAVGFLASGEFNHNV